MICNVTHTIHLISLFPPNKGFVLLTMAAFTATWGCSAAIHCQKPFPQRIGHLKIRNGTSWLPIEICCDGLCPYEASTATNSHLTLDSDKWAETKTLRVHKPRGFMFDENHESPLRAVAPNLDWIKQMWNTHTSSVPLLASTSSLALFLPYNYSCEGICAADWGAWDGADMNHRTGGTGGGDEGGVSILTLIFSTDIVPSGIGVISINVCRGTSMDGISFNGIRIK